VANAAANTFDYTIKQDPGANPSGTTGTVDLVTMGTALDLSGAYSGAHIVGGVQNGNTGPTVACQVWLGVANAGTAEADFMWQAVSSGTTTANGFTGIDLVVQTNIKAVNIAFARNTGQAVDCFANASYISAAS
jgi:hypothetical protein